jgi:hypothetical protein
MFNVKVDYTQEGSEIERGEMLNYLEKILLEGRGCVVCGESNEGIAFIPLTGYFIDLSPIYIMIDVEVERVNYITSQNLKQLGIVLEDMLNRRGEGMKGIKRLDSYNTEIIFNLKSKKE